MVIERLGIDFPSPPQSTKGSCNCLCNFSISLPFLKDRCFHMGKWLSWARHVGGAFAFAFVWWEMEIEMSSTEELQGVRRERGNGVLIRVAVNYVYESLQSPMSSVIKEQNCWLIALSHWVVVLVSDTILRPNHIWLSFIRVPPLLMNLGTDSAASNTPVSWLFVSPATHRHSRTLDPVITRNCSTSEITPHTSHPLY